MTRRLKDPWGWGTEARWKFYVLGTVVIGLGSSVIECLAFWYFLHAREIWAYLMVIGLGLLGGLITSIVLYPFMKRLGYLQ